MKFKITIKDPNIQDQITEFCQDSGLPDSVAENFLNKFFEYGEYVEIELDTKDFSARVVEQ